MSVFIMPNLSLFNIWATFYTNYDEFAISKSSKKMTTPIGQAKTMDRNMKG